MFNKIYAGDSIEVMNSFPEKSVDVVFADPPYNMQLNRDLFRPDLTKVDGVDDAWDKFSSFQEYDEFTQRWLTACRRVLKDTGTLWVIGSYHNIYRVGAILMNLDYWILNDVVWERTNPMPNFNGTRINNAHETLLWAQKIRGKPYTFHYHSMKMGNDDKQLRSVWRLPICSGNERLLINGEKAHSTQKPEALLHQILLCSTNRGDIVLDPFFGTGTTGAVAKRLGRNWIGIDRDPVYIDVAQDRIDSIEPLAENLIIPSIKPQPPKISFASLVAGGYIAVGEKLETKTGKYATIKADGTLLTDTGETGSIHQIATLLLGVKANGWTELFFRKEGVLHPIDLLRWEFS